MLGDIFMVVWGITLFLYWWAMKYHYDWVIEKYVEYKWRLLN